MLYEVITDIGLPFLIDFLNGWERNVRELDNAQLVRYEDLRGQPAETLQSYNFV